MVAVMEMMMKKVMAIMFMIKAVLLPSIMEFVVDVTMMIQVCCR